MSKIWLNEREPEESNEDEYIIEIAHMKNVLKRTRRKYQNVEWMHLNCVAVDEEDFVDFIVKFSMNFVNLHLISGNIDDDESPDDYPMRALSVPDGFQMPKLKNFKAIWTSSSDNFIDACENIEELDVFSNLNNKMIATLKNKKKLKSLSFHKLLVDGPELLEVEFKLEKLRFYIGNLEINENVKTFFETMAPTLTSLAIFDIRSDIFEILWQFPNLKELEVKNLKNVHRNLLLLATPLPGLQVLKISGNEFTKKIKIFILRSLINVETLVLKQIAHPDLDWIGRHMKSLKNLILKKIHTQDQGYNQNMKIYFHS